MGLRSISLGELHFSEWAGKICSNSISVQINFDSAKDSVAQVDEWVGQVIVRGTPLDVIFAKKDSSSARQVIFLPTNLEEGASLIDYVLEEHDRLWRCETLK